MNSSYWLENVETKQFPSLHENLEVDVVVVGAGITGITAAYLLKRSGATVALMERGRWGIGETGHTTAHLTYVTDTRLSELVQDIGRDHAEAAWDAGQAAIDQIAQIVEDESIDCEFAWVPGYLHQPAGADEGADLQKLQEDARLASQFRFDAAYEDRVPFMGRPGIRFANQAKFHPTKYLAALLKTIPGGGSHVFEQTEVTEIDPPTVKANGHVVRCRFVFVATHVPLQGAVGTVSAALFQTKLALYTTYAVGAVIPRNLVPEASFWDTSDPYQYLRIDRHEDHDYAILGGADHKTGQSGDPESHYAELEKRMTQLFPKAAIRHRWSGQVVETSDGLPFIGESAPGQFAATGFAGNGMTFGTLGAMMACDAFRGRSNPWRELLRIDRKISPQSVWDYIQENKDYPYYMAKDLLTRPPELELGAVGRGEGKIVMQNGAKAAAYRDGKGHLTLRSAICPHMGCTVRWNAAEKTWDCPCHGSRFDARGSVMAGPAETDLPDLE